MNIKTTFKKFFSDIKHHPFVFTISLILAIILHFYSIDITKTQLFYMVPIKIRNLDNSMIVKDIEKKYAKLIIKAPQSIVEILERTKFKIFIDLSKAKLGVNYVKLHIDKSNIPDEVRIVKLTPLFIKVDIDRKISKTLKVKPLIVNSPLEGYVISYVNVNPEYISIKGPASILKDMEIIKTKPINISGATSDLLRIVSLDDSFNYETKVKTIKVKIGIRREYKLIELSFNTIDILNKIDNFEYKILSPSSKKFIIKLLIPVEYYKKFNNFDVKLFIDVSQIFRVGEYEFKLQYKIPEWAKVIELKPENIQLKIDIKQNKPH